jgi:hypothetical protein
MECNEVIARLAVAGLCIQYEYTDEPNCFVVTSSLFRVQLLLTTTNPTYYTKLHCKYCAYCTVHIIQHRLTNSPRNTRVLRSFLGTCNRTRPDQGDKPLGSRESLYMTTYSTVHNVVSQVMGKLEERAAMVPGK